MEEGIELSSSAWPYRRYLAFQGMFEKATKEPQRGPELPMRTSCSSAVTSPSPLPLLPLPYRSRNKHPCSPAEGPVGSGGERRRRMVLGGGKSSIKININQLNHPSRPLRPPTVLVSFLYSSIPHSPPSLASLALQPQSSFPYLSLLLPARIWSIRVRHVIQSDDAPLPGPQIAIWD